MIGWIKKRIGLVVAAFGAIIVLQGLTLLLAFMALGEARQAQGYAADASEYARSASTSAEQANAKLIEVARDAKAAACYARYANADNVDAFIERLNCQPIYVPPPRQPPPLPAD